MMTLILKPLDPLFFGKGLPFAAGENSFSTGLSMPHPSVPYGALRSVFFSAHPQELPLANTLEDKTKPLRITRWNLYDGGVDSPVFPAPLDLCYMEEDDRFEPLSLETNDLLSSLPALPYQLKARKAEGESAAGYWVNQLDVYLAGEAPIVVHENEIVLIEAKTGLKRQAQTKTSEDRMLYQIPMQRYRDDIRFELYYEGLHETYDMLRLGGQSRSCAVNCVENAQDIPHGNIANGHFKLYLSTPALFDRGWLPGWINPDTMSGELAGNVIELCAACVGNAVHVSGWDMKAKKPKLMRLAVPAGSVYYFRLKDNTSSAQEAVLAEMHGRAVSDNEEDRKQGFGIAYVGGWAV